MNKLILTLLSVLTLTLTATAQPVLPYVAPKRTQSIQLAWDASPSPGVVATIIRRGTEPGVWIEQVKVPTPATSYVWTNLNVGTSYFVATAITDTGLESEYSNQISAVVTLPFAPNFRSAVPITVSIYRQGSDKLWAKVLELGPFYDEANQPAENFRSEVKIGSPIKMFPE